MSQPLRVAVVQYAPKIGRVQENITKAKELCSSITPRSVDLVCLPEMIFTGYVFSDAEAISPHLEDPQTGPTSEFCRDLASRLDCYVVAGYPERLDAAELVEGKVGANSAILYGPGGQWVGGYRKTNLFETDKPWAKAGGGFKTFVLPPPFNTLSIGICMDLNPQPPALWTLSTGPYEIADYCLEETPEKPRSNVLLLLNAWLDSGDEQHEDYDWETVQYWLARLGPLWKANPETDGEIRVSEPRNGDTTVIICNRTGAENGKVFAGTSALLKLQQGSNDPNVLGLMKRREEGIRTWIV